MQITNNTSFKIVAFGWHEQYGAGDKVEIEPGENSEVNGPYIGEMGGGRCHLALEGEISVHEEPDNDNGFHVSKGNHLNLGAGEKGVTVFHYSENYEFVYADD